MIKTLMIVLLCALVFSQVASPVAYAAETYENYLEKLSVSEALADPEIVRFLRETDKLDEFFTIQEQLRDAEYAATANYVNETFQTTSVTASDIEKISEEFDLLLPNESYSEIIDNGTMAVTINPLGTIVDIWWVYGEISDTSFCVKVALVDADNTLDVARGSYTHYRLSNSRWVNVNSGSINFSCSNITNGPIYTWHADKYWVKEKFEYEVTITDNGTSQKFTNKDEKTELSRYNFEANAYNKMEANGGQRHHFIPAKSLSTNGFNTGSAYCIRMMTDDHYNTGSYGSAQHVSTITTLLSKRAYHDAIQHEVDDFKSQDDSEGIYRNLQEKYYYEMIDCIYYYKQLFGLD